MSTISTFNDMPMERIIRAETTAEAYYSSDRMKLNNSVNHGGSSETGLTTREKMLHQLLDWAKLSPHFTDLKTDDQVYVYFFPHLHFCHARVTNILFTARYASLVWGTCPNQAQKMLYPQYYSLGPSAKKCYINNITQSWSY